MHGPLYPPTVAAHAALATAALALGLAALATAKGGRLHRRAGRGYTRAIAGVVATGVAIMALGRPRLYLATLVLLTAYPTWSGVRVLARKRPDVDPAQRATGADWAAAAATVALALAMLAATALGAGGRDAGAVRGFGAFVAAMAAYDLWRFARPAARPMGPRLWLREHIGKLTGAYFGAVSAFSGNVVTAVPDPWRVLVPNLVGAVVMAVFLVRLRRGGRRGAARRGTPPAPAPAFAPAPAARAS